MLKGIDIMKLNTDFINKLENYISTGLISKVKHNYFPLYILKYTRIAQLRCNDPKDALQWDNVLMECRGLVIDEDYNIIAKPFKKFFNQEELTVQQLQEYKNKKYVIQEKVDGSLIIIFYYMDEWVLATQKTFYSDVAIFAKKLFDIKKYNLDNNYTYLAEFVSPLTRVVIAYNEPNFILLSAKDKNFNELNLNLINSNIDKVREYDLKLTDLKSYNWKNHEGFVVKFEDGFRYKVKFDNYLKLHYILTGVSSKTIFDIMASGKKVEDLVINNDTPDEFDAWVMNIKNIFLSWYNEKYNQLINGFKILDSFLRNNPNSEKKDLVIFLQSQEKLGNLTNWSYLISNYNKKDRFNDQKFIWNYVNTKRLESGKSNRGLPVSFFNNKNFFEE